MISHRNRVLGCSVQARGRAVSFPEKGFFLGSMGDQFLLFFIKTFIQQITKNVRQFVHGAICALNLPIFVPMRYDSEQGNCELVWKFLEFIKLSIHSVTFIEPPCYRRSITLEFLKLLNKMKSVTSFFFNEDFR